MICQAIAWLRVSDESEFYVVRSFKLTVERKDKAAPCRLGPPTHLIAEFTRCLVQCSIIFLSIETLKSEFEHNMVWHIQNALAIRYVGVGCFTISRD